MPKDLNTEYVPSSCEGDDATFKGSVILRVPTIDERLEYMMEADMGFTVEEMEKQSTRERLKSQLFLMKKSYEHYVKVDLVRISDKKKYKTVDDLRVDSTCQVILQEVANKIAAGFSLGNVSGQS